MLPFSISHIEIMQGRRLGGQHFFNFSKAVLISLNGEMAGSARTLSFIYPTTIQAKELSYSACVHKFSVHR
jgi:hypothetical protein